jgi:nucleoid DNA-binding protein
MKLAELADVVSKQTKVDEVTVRKALKAALSVIKEQIAKEEKFLVPGLGSFIRKDGKEPGESRTLFKPAKEKAEEG